MKRYIQSASMMFTYKGEAHDTYEQITNGADGMKLNTICVNESLGTIFYINNKGYLHVLMNSGAYVEDCVLTKDNMIKHSSWYCRKGTPEWEELKQTIKEAKRV